MTKKHILVFISCFLLLDAALSLSSVFVERSWQFEFEPPLESCSAKTGLSSLEEPASQFLYQIYLPFLLVRLLAIIGLFFFSNAARVAFILLELLRIAFPLLLSLKFPEFVGFDEFDCKIVLIGYELPDYQEFLTELERFISGIFVGVLFWDPGRWFRGRLEGVADINS